MSYHSRCYLREKYDTLEYDMKVFLRIYDMGEDEIPEEKVERCRADVVEACRAIINEVQK